MPRDTHFQPSIDSRMTVDTALQTLARRLLTGKQGSIVAIDPRSGEVKCMVSSTVKDEIVGDDGTVKDTAENINRAISVEYSPGSTFKTAQTLALFSMGAVARETSNSCSKGFWHKNVHIGCHEHRSPLKLVEALGLSCNSFYCKEFTRMVNDRTHYPSKLDAINTWHSYMASMGLGRQLGFDMPGEAAGVIPTPGYLERLHNGRWNGETVTWIGIGQGEVETTPLQLCNLAASIANRGWWIVPHIYYHPGDTTYMRHNYTIASEEAYKVTVEGMRLCVTRGTGTAANSADYLVCGKTGTAENIGHDHSLFIGFAPMNNPKIAVAVVIENGGWGADLACPLAGIIMEQSIKGSLSQRSENKVEQWERYAVVPTSIAKRQEAERDMRTYENILARQKSLTAKKQQLFKERNAIRAQKVGAKLKQQRLAANQRQLDAIASQMQSLYDERSSFLAEHPDVAMQIMKPSPTSPTKPTSPTSPTKPTKPTSPTKPSKPRTKVVSFDDL